MTLPKVAICIPTFNQSQYLAAAVKSACQQTYPNLEVWVSDDASSDETPTVMEQLCQQFPQVRYHRQPQNLGLTANNNWLFQQSDAPLIVRLDSDDVLLPDYVATLVSLMEQNPTAGYAHGAIQQIDAQGQPLSVVRIFRQHSFQAADQSLKAAIGGYRVAANILMFRATALQQVGFYDTRFQYGEDYDLSIRLADAGYGNVYTNQVLACYRVWSDGQIRPRRKQAQLQGYYWIFTESLQAAFKQRGWETKPLDQQRIRLAIAHAAYCYLPLFTAAERQELMTKLLQLGDSQALRLRLFWLSLGFAPLLEWQRSSLYQIKSWIKNKLSSMKPEVVPSPAPTPLSITVLIPTYQRPQELARCLSALKQQQRQPDRVLVTVRDTDHATWDFLKTFDAAPLPLSTISVSRSGLVAALNQGLEQIQEDIVVMTDDDAAPHPDWLFRLEQHYQADPQVGGVGGRDRVFQGDRLEAGQSEIVGRVQWFGRVIGQHHIGIGPARPVDVLKGVNMSFRRSAIQNLQFDERLKGNGAQIHSELGFCLAIKRAGWKLIYDPEIVVDHFPAQRFDEDQRHQFNAIAQNNSVHNQTLILLEHLPPVQRLAFLLWSTLIGSRGEPGLLQLLRFLPQEGAIARQKWWATLQGRWLGWQNSGMIPSAWSRIQQKQAPEGGQG